MVSLLICASVNFSHSNQDQFLEGFSDSAIPRCHLTVTLSMPIPDFLHTSCSISSAFFHRSPAFNLSNFMKLHRSANCLTRKCTQPVGTDGETNGALQLP